MTIFGKPPLSFISTLASALALLVPGVAFASNFNSPLYGCDYGTYSKCYISAYYDIAKGDKDVAANGKDWNCGSKAYSGHNGTDIGIGGNSDKSAVFLNGSTAGTCAENQQYIDMRECISERIIL